MRYTKYVAVLLLASACIFACKKDEDEDIPSLNGGMNINLPGYVYPGYEVNVFPSGVYRKNTADTLLTYTCFNSFKNKSDTLRLEGDPADVKQFYHYTIPDTLGQFYLSFTISAKGYSSRYSTSYFYVVDSTLNTGSLSGYNLEGAGSAVDLRDGREYPTISAGGSEWLMTNMAWEGAGAPYQNAYAAGRLFGRFYTWTEAQTACPDGWRLPTDAEWIALAQAAGASSVSSPDAVPDAAGLLMGNINFHDKAMWSFAKDVRITDALSFSAIPVGYATYDGTSYTFFDYGKYACFWTADAVDSDLAIARYIFWDKPAFSATAMPKDGFAASVRCIR